MLPTPYVASLRVYEPIDSFEAKDQLRWSKISDSTQTLVDEQNISLSRMIQGDPSAFKTDGVHLLEIDGKKFIAPWSTTTRCWAAFREKVIDDKGNIIVPMNKRNRQQKDLLKV